MTRLVHFPKFEKNASFYLLIIFVNVIGTALSRILFPYSFIITNCKYVPIFHLSRIKKIVHYRTSWISGIFRSLRVFAGRERRRHRNNASCKTHRIG